MDSQYADWPVRVNGAKIDPWAEPEWMLLFYNKTVTVSNGEESAMKAVDETK